MVRVFIESPYRANDPREFEENLGYAKACMRDCIRRGESPFASHLLYPRHGVLDDDIPAQRSLGMACAAAWAECADMIAVYTDRGFSSGMREGIARAEKARQRIEYRSLAESLNEGI